MTMINCARCKQSKPGLDEAPLPNELGDKLMRQTCSECWDAWVAQQLMIMNEFRLDPMNDEHSKFLDQEMIKFLALS